MIGRAAQLRDLEQHLDLACSDAGRVVFVAGDAGVGKTRLLREFAGRVRASEGAAVLEGHCYDENPAPLYGPFADALRPLIRERGPRPSRGPSAREKLRGIVISLASTIRPRKRE